jgi:hypothetical protein
VDWEQTTSLIVDVAPLPVPGLLQTRDYAYSIMVAPGSGVPADEVVTQVEVRLGRRDILTKPKPPGLLVLLGQNALTHEVGGRQVMHGQLRHLLEMAAPNIEIRVVPAGCGVASGPGGFIHSHRFGPCHEDHKQVINRFRGQSTDDRHAA